MNQAHRKKFRPNRTIVNQQKNTLTPEEFSRRATAAIDDTITISNKTINEPVKISENIRCNGLIIKDCTFNETVVFENVDLGYGIKFYNCIFSKNCVFIYCRASGYSQDFSLLDGHILFDQCSLNALNFHVLNKIERGISIKNKTSIQFGIKHGISFKLIIC